MNTPDVASVAMSAPTPVISISPVVVSVPGRAVDLHMRISAPVTGRDLPIIIFSHGHGNSWYLSSLNGYGPVANFWAAHGFVVIQPTHLDSRILGLRETSGGPLFWRSRAQDIKSILDRLDLIEASVPQISGRLDRSRIAVAGHSMGAYTASMLLGVRVTDPDDGTEVDMVDSRIKAGVLFSAPGNGGADLSTYAAENYSFFLTTNFAHMATPALVVAGEKDVSPHLTVRGADWYTDPYFLSTGPKSLLTVSGAEHGLGGVEGYDAEETTDENPERLSGVLQLSWAYLRTTFYPEDPAWSAARAALIDTPNPLGRIESR